MKLVFYVLRFHVIRGLFHFSDNDRSRKEMQRLMHWGKNKRRKIEVIRFILLFSSCFPPMHQPLHFLLLPIAARIFPFFSNKLLYSYVANGGHMIIFDDVSDTNSLFHYCI